MGIWKTFHLLHAIHQIHFSWLRKTTTWQLQKPGITTLITGFLGFFFTQFDQQKSRYRYIVWWGIFKILYTPFFVSLLLILGYKTFVLLLKNIAKRIDITHIYMCSNFKTIHDVLWYIYTLLSDCLKKNRVSMKKTKIYRVISTYRISNRGSWLVESRTALKFEFVSPFLL